MIYEKPIEGYFIRLRSVEQSDAEFILRLRLDESLNAYINKVENDVDLQRQWIKAQQIRENDYYFIFENQIDHTPYGTISVYNIDAKEAELGRWVSCGNALVNLDSIVTAYDFIFDTLGLERAVLEVVRENERVLNFHKNFGAVFTGRPIKQYFGFATIQMMVEKENYASLRDTAVLLLRRK